jgi:ribonuclease Z
MLAHSVREDPVTIYGPPGTMRLMEAVRVIVPQVPYEIRVCEIDGGAEVALPGEVKLRTLDVDHRVQCLAYSFMVDRMPEFQVDRAEALGVPVQHWKHLQSGEPVRLGGRVIEPADVLGPPRAGVKVAFVTDTRPTGDLPDFVAGADLLICEGMYGSEAERDRAEERGHMVFSEAAGIARAAGAKRLWLTHFSPAMQNPADFLHNARDIFPETEIGQTHHTETIRYPDESAED